MKGEKSGMSKMIPAARATTSETNGKIRKSEAVGDIIGASTEAGTRADGLMSAGEIRVGEAADGRPTTESEHPTVLQLRRWTGKMSLEMAEA